MGEALGLHGGGDTTQGWAQGCTPGVRERETLLPEPCEEAMTELRSCCGAMEALPEARSCRGPWRNCGAGRGDVTT